MKERIEQIILARLKQHIGPGSYYATWHGDENDVAKELADEINKTIGKEKDDIIHDLNLYLARLQGCNVSGDEYKRRKTIVGV